MQVAYVDYKEILKDKQKFVFRFVTIGRKLHLQQQHQQKSIAK